MSVTGKTFMCYNCKKGVTLSSVGQTFVCPHCQKTNTLPAENTTAVQVDKTKATIDGIRALIAIGLVIMGLYYFFKF